jgi:hypothetical protein
MAYAPPRDAAGSAAIAKLRAGDHDAIERITEARSQSYFDRIKRSAEHWLPIVKQMRPDHRWEDVARVLNARRSHPEAGALPRWSVEMLRRATRHLILDGLADPNLLRTAPRNTGNERLLTLVAGIARANPELTLTQIGAQLEAMYERTPLGGTRWGPSSVKSLIDRARKLGVMTAEQN